ncbi:COPII-coated vesicle component Erv41 [Taphrina deformans PYCC 5710]|uniref:Endoplasmic reticulum-Golgi intermediate compartment protein n=1 Tax=Taphrina deformans (strain PYCC 5710 / ATCC 11124 / CBS 356.35 / IMI 108563 / JCM 9778 / NBRC 8474) TaxID=1097556 RepID=R4XCM4_TAPDE|nr:COPII-coated vesicle component Erv41 [Taphrina deformans PYCC 5710]|eukprot:CCG83576.1 COPII-coated vesicle component Erv41 [Taphrina deformans PYCC 5710]
MDNFNAPSGLQVFDAFPKVEKSFRAERTTRGAIFSIFLTLSLIYLFISEFTFYLGGYETHHFEVERQIKGHMNINVDMTISMPCDDIAINVQDVTGDRILAGNALKKQRVDWNEDGSHHLDAAHQQADAYDLQRVIKSARKKNFKKGKERKNGKACRVYGTLEVHHAQGDFHITAEGVGYMSTRRTFLEDMNFTHRIDELSFGTYYPKLINPLDGTHADSLSHFHRFQYFLNIVPTTYTSGSRHIKTNQYAVTESSRHAEGSMGEFFPGIFFKYDIEPVSLVITDTRMPFLQFLVRLLGVLGGIVASTDLTYKAVSGMYTKMRNPMKHRGTSILDRRRDSLDEKNRLL